MTVHEPYLHSRWQSCRTALQDEASTAKDKSQRLGDYSQQPLGIPPLRPGSASDHSNSPVSLESRHPQTQQLTCGICPAWKVLMPC